MSQSFEFVIELGQASTCLVVLLFEGSQVIGSSHEVGVDSMGLALNLLAEVFLLSEFGE